MCAISVLAILTPLIANDKPLMVYHNDAIYLPMLQDYPETTFGGVFETTANYKDPAVMELIDAQGFAIMPPIAYAADTLVLDADTPHPSGVQKEHWLGTDGRGRDVLAFVMYALRTSLLFALGLTVVGSAIGLIAGAVMGYFGGAVDLVGQRLLEIWLGLPQLFILMILASLFEPSVWVLFGIMSAFGWLYLVQLSRATFLQLRQSPFVMTAKNLGVPSHIIMIRHILPSVLMLSLSQLPFVMVANISALTALDFLGLGLPVGTASLGELLAQAKTHMNAPHLVLSGVGVLCVILVLLVFMGEGLRRVFDVR